MPLLPTAAPATVPAPPMPLLVRGTSSIETTVLFGLALDAVAAPAPEAPCAAVPLAVSDTVPAELPVAALSDVVLPEVVPADEPPDWS